MISMSASTRSACISSKVFTAGPSATIVLEKLALEASPESMYSGIAKAAAAARNSAWMAATFLSTGAVRRRELVLGGVAGVDDRRVGVLRGRPDPALGVVLAVLAGPAVFHHLPNAAFRGVDVPADHADAGPEFDDLARGLQRPHGIAQVALQGVPGGQAAGPGHVDVGLEVLHLAGRHRLAKADRLAQRADVAPGSSSPASRCPRPPPILANWMPK